MQRYALSSKQVFLVFLLNANGTWIQLNACVQAERHACALCLVQRNERVDVEVSGYNLEE